MRPPKKGKVMPTNIVNAAQITSRQNLVGSSVQMPDLKS
jgi:hypothetical protein